MKNIVGIGLFFLLVIGGGLWLTSQDETPKPLVTDTSGTKKYATKTDETEEAIELPIPSPEGPWPKAIAAAKDFNFGKMVVGSEMEHTFTILNEGEAVLELVAGKATCKCTRFDVKPTSVKPGEEAQVVVHWKTPMKDANFRHGGPVYTNDPKTAELYFTVGGVVDEAFEMLPVGAWHLSAESGLDGEAHGYVFSKIHSDFEITSIASSSEFVNTTATEVSSQEFEEVQSQSGILKGYKITASLKPDTPPGLINSEIKVQLDHGEQPWIVQLIARKEGPIKILPPPGALWSVERNGLVMGRFPKGQGTTAMLDLLTDQRDMEVPLEFSSIETSPKYISVEVGEGTLVGDSKMRYPLTIKIPPGIPVTSRGSNNPGTIRIATNHPSGQTIDIALSFTAF